MEVRGQEINDVRMSGGGSGGGGRREGNHNGTTTNFLTYTAQQQQQQTLDHHRGGGSNSSSKPPPAAIRYRECLRNHAASVGGNVYDGCGEFMPGGEEGSLEALKCAACDCHRNFHRKEIDGETAPAPAAHIFSPGSRRGGSGSGGGHLVHALQLPPALPSPVMHHHHHPHLQQHHNHHQRYLHSSSPPAAVQPMSVAFGGGGGGSAATCGTESSSEDLNAFPNSTSDMGMGTVGMGGMSPHPPQYVMSKKRFRTKFTAEQKDKMMEFAEKVGWRINKQDEEAVERFCAEVGVRRQVFKVWMHNNKNVRKQLGTPDDHHHHQHLNHHHQMRVEDDGNNGQQQQQRGEGML